MAKRLTLTLSSLLFVAVTSASLLNRPVSAASTSRPSDSQPAASVVTSTCLACHRANPSAGAKIHIAEWERSQHGLRNIGCEQCHGGNPNAVTAALAHGLHYRSREPESPTNRHNMQRTCGKCHAPEFEAFQTGTHFTMVQAGNLLAPRCVTCHGEMAADKVSVDSIEAQCSQCHAAGRSSPHPEYVAGIRLVVVQGQMVGALNQEMRRFINKLPASPLRAQLEADLTGAEVRGRIASVRAHGGGSGYAGPMVAAHEQTFALSKRILSMSEGVKKQ